MVHFQLEFCALLWHLIELSCYLYYLKSQKNKVQKEEGDFCPGYWSLKNRRLCLPTCLYILITLKKIVLCSFYNYVYILYIHIYRHIYSKCKPYRYLKQSLSWTKVAAEQILLLSVHSMVFRVKEKKFLP